MISLPISRAIVLALAAASAAMPFRNTAAAPAGAAALAREYVLDLPVTMDERAIGELSVVVRGMALVAVDVNSWNALGSRHFAPEVVQALASSAINGKIPVASFDEAKLPLRYDPTRLMLFLEPQREQRAIEGLALQQRAASNADDLGKGESRFSAYMNVRASHDYVSGFQDAESTSTPHLVLDGAARFFGPRGAALEWSLFYDGDTEDRWKRGELRLVHDDMERAIRYSAGDISFQTGQFQGFAPMLGISAERRFIELQPWRAIASSGQQSFVLSRPSRVTVYMNGAFQRSFQLAPGRYRLTDFTAADGATDVRIEVEDNTGQREVIEFTLFREATLLAENESEFSFNAGVRRKTDVSTTIDYDYGRPAWSGFVRYGVSDTLTLGASYQGEQGLHVAGIEGVIATASGNFSGTLNASRRDDLGDGHAGAARWTYDLGDGADRRMRRIDLSASYTSKLYSTLGVEQIDNRFSWQFLSRFMTPLPFDTQGTLSAGHARSRNPAFPDESRLTLMLSRRFQQVSANVGIERVLGREDELRAFLTLSIPLGPRQRLLGSIQTRDNRRRLEWTHAPVEAINSLSGTVGVERSDLGNAALADMSYTANRFVASVRQDIAEAGLNASATVRRTRAQFQTALAFSGGRAAFGRPVGDAFAIVSRHPTLMNAEILVNPGIDGPVAVADAFGPALVPNLTSYRPQQVVWDARELPAGYDLGNTRRMAMPSFRSGTHYEAGSAASITGIGNAFLPDGSPLSLVAGELQASDGRTYAPATVFTNRQGRFVAQALTSGSYTITFKSDPPRVLQFRIDENASGYVDLGKFMVKEK